MLLHVGGDGCTAGDDCYFGLIPRMVAHYLDWSKGVLFNNKFSRLIFKVGGVRAGNLVFYDLPLNLFFSLLMFRASKFSLQRTVHYSEADSYSYIVQKQPISDSNLSLKFECFDRNSFAISLC